MRDRCTASAIAVLASACGFDSTGVGTPGGSAPDLTTSASEDPSTSTPDEPTPSTSSSDAATTMTTADATEGAAGPSMLVFVDAPIFDYADVALGTAETHELVLRNEGSGGAHAIEASIDGSPFAFAGGSYPGDGGTCGGSLAANASCTIVLSATPEQWGPTTGELVVGYEDAVMGPASAEVGLGVRGVGETTDLLDNGDAEQGGAPPVGWTQIDGGGADWQATTANAYEGQLSISPGADMNVTTNRLRQAVEIDQWTELVDGDGITFRLRAQTRSLNGGDDPHYMLLRFFDANQNLIDEVQSAQYDGGAWNPVELVRTAPPGTRAAHVQLRCERVVGGACSAYFDAVSLVASYP